MKKMALIISGIMLLSGVVPCLAADSGANPRVLVNGQAIESEQQAVIINDRTFLPMRDIIEAVGGAVGWNGNTNEAVAAKGGDIVRIPINEKVIYKNGMPVEIDAPAVIINDRTFLPVRAVSETLGCSVEWYKGTVSITADMAHNPVLVDFLHNKFENTEIQIRDDNGGPLSDNPSYFTAKNRIKSYFFFDIDYDGEEELIINSEPDVKAAELDWWEAPVCCISIWDHIGADVVNVYAKESVPHRNAYKPFITVSDGRLCLMEYYHYSSSGENFDERRSFGISDGKIEKIKEIVSLEHLDNMSEEKYNRHLAAGDFNVSPSFAEHFVDDGEKRVKLVYAAEYVIDGAECGRGEAMQALDAFDRDCVIIENWVEKWRK